MKGDESMDLDDLRAGWERLAETNPRWAVLTDPAHRGDDWGHASEFLATGESEVAIMLARLQRFGLRPGDDAKALDFGCGVGRLSQALARRYALVEGVDIATAMLDAAATLDPPPNITFRHNAAPDLTLFGNDTFDLVYSSIVLQHMPAPLALGYIGEFARVAKRDAVIVFQAPDEYRVPPARLTGRLRDARVRLALGTRLRGGRPERATDAAVVTLAAHPTPMADIVAKLKASKAQLIDVVVTNSLDPDFNGRLVYSPSPPEYGWVSRQYTAVVGSGGAEPSC